MAASLWCVLLIPPQDIRSGDWKTPPRAATGPCSPPLPGGHPQGLGSLLPCGPSFVAGPGSLGPPQDTMQLGEFRKMPCSRAGDRQEGTRERRPSRPGRAEVHGRAPGALPLTNHHVFRLLCADSSGTLGTEAKTGPCPCGSLCRGEMDKQQTHGSPSGRGRGAGHGSSSVAP